jgi:uncharacterized protein YbjT (DUF2867 family)
MKKAILFGSSGFVGSCLLDELLNNNDYEQVTIIIRKDLNISHPKLRTLIGDYHSLPAMKDTIVADDVFITLGTTKKNTPDQVEYYNVDHNYPVLAAKFAKENGAKSVFLLSAVGANQNSGIFYVKTKGETERDIIALDYEHTNIFRPSMLLGSRKENRPMEKVFITVWSAINPLFIGKMSKNKGIDGKDVARAMNNAAKNQTEKVKIYHWKEMQELL